MTIAVLGVATSAGAYGVGQELAPQALREAGLLMALTDAGLEVIDEGDSPVSRFSPDPVNRTCQNLDRVVDVAEDLSSRVERAVSRDRLPVVLGGDCTITLGVVAGLWAAGRTPAVAYVDGDLDLSTPATTTSGVLDAMGVAHMLDLDGVAEPLASVGGHRPLLSGAELSMVGFEDMDSDEAALLSERGVHHVPASRVREDPSQAAQATLKALGDSRALVVHFDLDVIDSIDCPLAHYPHFNTGVSLDKATECLTALCAAPNLAALVITELNPHNDPDAVHLPRIVSALTTALAARR